MPLLKVPEKLTRHAKNVEDKAELESMYRSSAYLLRKIRAIVEKEIDDIIIREEDAAWYEKVFRWDLKQADFRGYRRGLRRIAKLLPDQTTEVK